MTVSAQTMHRVPPWLCDPRLVVWGYNKCLEETGCSGPTLLTVSRIVTFRELQ